MSWTSPPAVTQAPSAPNPEEVCGSSLVNNTCTPGNPDYHTVAWQELLSSGARAGPRIPPIPLSRFSNLLYTVQTSERFSCSVISVVPAKTYTAERLQELVLFTVGLVLVFVLITLLCMHDGSPTIPTSLEAFSTAWWRPNPATFTPAGTVSRRRGWNLPPSPPI
ncbi:MAG: hypothetical protein ACLU9S_18205 [Oscillospiraceae bacterium]